MADNDIYNSQQKYRNFKKNLSRFALPPNQRGGGRGARGKYQCRNVANLEHFKALFRCFDARDTSFVRRNRLINTMRMICHATAVALPNLTRADVDGIIAFMHRAYVSPKSKSDFIRDIKFIWRLLFPEQDKNGRIDDTVTPYQVRHLSPRIDKSRQKRRQDKLTWEEFERIINYFSKDPRMQCYLSLAIESLGRPQEMLYIRLKDVEVHDNYAKLWISEHGKEGTGFLQCIDSYPYLVKWMAKHPLRKDNNTFLFINTGRIGFGDQLKPTNINKQLRCACARLGINKPITAYSLKRNGVTMRRLRGESDMEIQHAARWTSTKQLKTYDMSDHDDAMKLALSKRGLLSQNEISSAGPQIRTCAFCNTANGFDAFTCSSCRRPLDRRKIAEQEKEKEEEVTKLREELSEMKATVKSREVADQDMAQIMEIPQIQALVKEVYKMRAEFQNR